MPELAPADERLRAAVLRVSSAGDVGKVLGTAFVIAPRLALTAEHVVRGRQAEQLVLDDGEGGSMRPVPVTSITVVPNKPGGDLALLAAAVDEARILPCARAAHSGSSSVALGFSPAAPRRGGRELRLSARGQVTAAYPGDGSAYRIEDAFEFAGDMAEGGFSGAPIMDVMSGAVFAVISGGDPARGRSWAVSLQRADEGWPKLASALTWNDNNIPRFGPLVNAPGARLSCALSNTAAVESLQLSGKFNPNRNVPRAQMALVQSFQKQPRPVLAIVGNSNTGKSWLMCDLTRDAANPPRLLLLAGKLPRRDVPNLEEFSSAAIRSAWPAGYDMPEAPNAAKIAAALKAGGERLVVLLDGLNEAVDIPGLLRDWWPDAIGWARKSDARLLFTTRPELWASIIRATPNAGAILFNPEARDEMIRCDPEQHALHLGDFTPLEAKKALQLYGLDKSLGRSIGAHPLMFRIAAALGLPEGVRYAGRYTLIDEFVNHHVEEARDRLQRGSTLTLRARVRDLASRLQINGINALEFGAAREAAGDDSTLDALIASGLLSEAGAEQHGRAEALRFTFDQVAEAMAPAPGLPDELFDPGIRNAQVLRRDTVGLLRLEADGNEVGYQAGLRRLLDLLRTQTGIESLRPLIRGGEIPSYVAGALPLSRSNDVAAIMHALVQIAPVMEGSFAFRWLVDWISGAPLAPDKVASLLIEIAPWGGDGPMVRFKDWSDEANRAGFEKYLESQPVHGGSDHSPARRLNTLLRDHRGATRPVLINCLNSERPFEKDGEAYVWTMAAGLLFHRRHDDFSGLVLCLLAQEEKAAAHILRVIATTDAGPICDLALSALLDPLRQRLAIDVLADTGNRLDPARKALAIKSLESLLAADTTPAYPAARALLRLAPAHLGAWDCLARGIEDGQILDELPTVPVERFEQALTLAKVCPERCIFWMRNYEQPEPAQLRMVDCVSELFASGRARYEISLLVAEIMRTFAKATDKHRRPWIPLARHIALRDPQSRYEIILAVFRYGRFVGCQELTDLAELLAENVQDEREVSIVVQSLLELANIRQLAWMPWFARIRIRNPAFADINAAFELEGCHGTDILRAELLEYWANLPHGDLSPMSIALLVRHRTGMSLGETFDLELDFLSKIVAEAKRHGASR